MRSLPIDSTPGRWRKRKPASRWCAFDSGSSSGSSAVTAAVQTRSRNRRSAPSPDARTQAVRTDHGVAVLAAPRLLELGHVAERSVHAPLRRGVRIGGHLEPLGLGTLDLAPDLRPA